MRFCVGFVLVALTGFCMSDDGEEVIKVQTRDLYLSKKPNNEPGRDPVYPNDFGLARDYSRAYDLPLHDHHHGPYHHHHGYHSGPPDPDRSHFQDGFTSRPVDNRNGEGVDFSSLNSSGIPLDFAKTISEYSVSDLLLNVIENGPEMEEKTFLVASRFGDDDENNTERNAAQVARLAKCMPELTTVRIAESNDPNVFYIPECTRIERCGGCCAHTLLSCQPTETETVTFSVVKTEYTGNRKLKYVSKEPVLVEKHNKCRCSCKVKAEDCNSYQEYKESECHCVCKNIDEEKKCYKNSNKKLWNPDVCACQCREVTPCSTGLQFDYNECRCVQSQLKRRYILTDIRKEQPEQPSDSDY